MSKQKNPVWRFLASVKLALTVLIILAATSIVGTIIKQGQSPEYYLTEYGQSTAQFFDALQLNRMYSSWWYVALLALFALNLLVCSIERLPAVWRTINHDNLLSPPKNLEAMSCSYQQLSKTAPEALTDQISNTLTSCGWRNIQKRPDGESILLFMQKGVWSRLGVYVVHLSILVILAGAILGGLFGFQAFVYIPEGLSTGYIYKRYTKEPYHMGFSLHGDNYEKTLYPTGMVKQYHADLTVTDPEKESPYRKTIIVNDPLSYKGLTFYLGDSQPTSEFFIEIINRTNGMRQAFRIPTKENIEWPEANIVLQVEKYNREMSGDASQAKIVLSSSSGSEETSAWIPDRSSQMVSYSGQNLDIYIRQIHKTLLLISKDPGVSTVYAGCIMMLIGLAICLFFSHQRVWVRISPQKNKETHLLISGVSNKNKFAFEQAFQKLTDKLNTEKN